MEVVGNAIRKFKSSLSLFPTSSLPTPKVLENQKYEIEVAQTEALTTLAQATKEISTFLNGGGLANILSGYARSQAVGGILQGLASHDGRNALDARVIQQNALDMVTQVEKVFEKYGQILEAKGKEDPDIHDAENDYVKWANKYKKKA